MKKLLLMLMLCLPMLASAQTEPKYLAGAVTLNEGKVSFQKEFQAPSLSKQEIYHLLLKWSQQHFQPKGDFHARVLYTNETDGTIAIGGEEYLVFSSTALSLDRSRIYYQLYLNCQPGKVNIEMTRIRYWYDEQRDGGVRYNAEEWIVDDMALNKHKNKLAPICGKFRRETIDLKDDLFKKIQDELAHAVLNNSQMANTSQPVQAAQPTITDNQVVVITAPTTQPVTSTPVVAATPTAPAPKSVPALKLTPAQPVDRSAHIQASARITLTANGEQIELGKESWGGFGQLFGKEVMFCLLNQNKKLSNLLLDQSENFTVSFYDAGQSEPWLTVHCKKMMKQTVSGEEAQKMNAQNDATKSYNMFVGEVVK